MKAIAIMFCVIFFLGAKPLNNTNDIIMRAYMNGYLQAIIDQPQTKAESVAELNDMIFESAVWYSKRLGLSYTKQQIKKLVGEK